MAILIWSMSKIVIRDCLRPVILMMFTWMSLCALASSSDVSKRLFTGSSHTSSYSSRHWCELLSVLLASLLQPINFYPSCLLICNDGKIICQIIWNLRGLIRPRMLVRYHANLMIMLITCLGLLHLLYSCVCMMFWRVFMRISYSCPLHLKFGLTVEQWSELIQLTSESIDWLDAHERVYDVWLLVAYAATCCALVQVTLIIPIYTINTYFSMLVSYLYSTKRWASSNPAAQITRLCEALGRSHFSWPYVSQTQGWWRFIQRRLSLFLI